MEPIRIKLEDITEEGVNLGLDLEPGGLDLLDFGDARPSGRIGGQAFIAKSGKKIRVSLRLSFAFVMPCSRCLRETKQGFSESGEFIFTPVPPKLLPEQRLEEEDFSTIHFSGEEIDIAPMIREMIILALPMKPLCKPDCKGLCPLCGADRNRESCEHGEETQPGDPRWAGLRAFRKGKGK